MKTKELYKLDDTVKSVLERYPETRSDDFILVYSVYREINFKDVTIKPFHEIMLYHKQFGLPPFESVTRARRKIQSKHPELANEKTKKLREKQENEYIKYAIDYDSTGFMKLVDSVK